MERSVLPPEITDAYHGRSICVTGAAGFIGGHLVDALLAVGARVHAIDDLSASSLAHLGELLAVYPERFKLTYGSILDDIAIREATEEADIMFHLASHGSDEASLEDPERTFEVNTAGTLRVLKTALREEVPRVVCASVEVEQSGESVRSTPYLASRRAAEELVRAWGDSFGIHACALRLTTVFGPRQRSDQLTHAPVAQHMTRATQGLGPLPDESATYDLVYVEDAVHAFLLAGTAPAALSGSSIKIASGERCSEHDLIQRVEAAVHGAPVSRGPAGGTLSSTLGELPRTDLDEALQSTASWYRSAFGSTA